MRLVKVITPKQTIHCLAVANIHSDELALWQHPALYDIRFPTGFLRVDAALFQPRVLQADVVIIIDIVDTNDIESLFGQSLHHTRANKTGGTGN